MAVAKNHLCMGCMSEKNDTGVCNKCGYEENSFDNDVDFLHVETLLNNRYIVGKALSSNGESVIYIGYDTLEDFKVIIREFMPSRIAARNHSTMAIRPLKDKETVYKSMLAEFEDLCATLKNMSSIKGLTQVIELFNENNTVYAIYRYINSITLSELLNRCGGEIKWSSCKKIFLQLLNTISQVHKKGLIHAGLSPKTILLDEKGAPYISSFSIYDVRAFDSEIDYELFEGYSAPEQYINGQWGEWTDIYSLAAVLYRTLTGTMPPDPQLRKCGDNLVDAKLLDSSIPDNVSDAVRNGMQLSVDTRTSSIDDFTAQLLESTDTNTAIYETDKIHTEYYEEYPVSSAENFESIDTNTEEPKHNNRKKKKHKKRNVFLSVFIPMLLTTVILGTVGWLIASYKYEEWQNSVSSFISSSSESSVSSTESTASDVPQVPDFVGQYIDKITSNEEYGALFDFTINSDYNDLYPEGVVFDQSPDAKTIMPNKGTVILSVSKGPETVKLPNLTGSTLELAIQTLTEKELKYEIIYVSDEKYAEGLVAFTSPAGDTMVSKNDEVMVFTKKPNLNTSNSSEASSEASSGETSSRKAKKIIREDESKVSVDDF